MSRNPFHVPQLPTPIPYSFTHGLATPSFHRHPLHGRFMHHHMRGEFVNRFSLLPYYSEHYETNYRQAVPHPQEESPMTQEWHRLDQNVRLDAPQNHPKSTEKSSEADVIKRNKTEGNPEGLLVKKYNSEKPGGKLIPRQVSKRKVLPEGLLGKVTQTTRDSVNEELRKQAFILGKYQCQLIFLHQDELCNSIH